MESALNIYKPQGMTPLQVLDTLRNENSEYKDIKMTYAGRLDPMAEGVLIVLIGEAIKRKEEFLDLDKIYEVEIVFGFGTDTHDLLGIPTKYDMDGLTNKRIEDEVDSMEGTFQYPFPNYSSKPVRGKPLFQWAREGKLGEIEIPKRTMRIYDASLLDVDTTTAHEMMSNIEVRIENIKGDFRQGVIKDKWNKLLTEGDQKNALIVARLRVHCASGTYVRTLIHELGKRLGGDATIVKLIRTRVGEYLVQDAARLK